VSAIAERLEELYTAVSAAKHRVAELDAARRDGARRVERARMELLEHYRAQGRGEAPADDKGDLAMGQEPITEEQRLVAALHEAEGGLTMRPVQYPMGNGDADIALVAVDERAEAMHEGAVEMLAERESELQQHVASNLTALAVERAPRAGEIRDRVAVVLIEGRAVADAYERTKNGWVELLKLAGRKDLIAEIPANPLRGINGLEAAVLPMPVSFT
jgi:hypothetical protein